MSSSHGEFHGELGVSALCSIGLQSVVVDKRPGLAALLPEETYQADTSNDRVDCVESDPRGSSDSVEDIGAASVVAGLCLGVAEDSRVARSLGSWIEGWSFSSRAVQDCEESSTEGELCGPDCPDPIHFQG